MELVRKQRVVYGLRAVWRDDLLSRGGEGWREVALPGWRCNSPIPIGQTKAPRSSYIFVACSTRGELIGCIDGVLLQYLLSKLSMVVLVQLNHYSTHLEESKVRSVPRREKVRMVGAVSAIRRT